jgi:hypothetical protein
MTEEEKTQLMAHINKVAEDAKKVAVEAAGLATSTALDPGVIAALKKAAKAEKIAVDKEKANDALLADASGHYANYAEYNKQLRIWLVSFGLGGPVLFFTHPEVLKGLPLEDKRWIVGAFLIGCAIQVALAIINKTVSWGLYYHVDSEARLPGHTKGLWHRCCDGLSNSYFLDIAADVLSTALFGYAVWMLAHAALKVSM